MKERSEYTRTRNSVGGQTSSGHYQEVIFLRPWLVLCWNEHMHPERERVGGGGVMHLGSNANLELDESDEDLKFSIQKLTARVAENMMPVILPTYGSESSL